jgi:DNA-binding protein H-NS
MLLAVLPNLSMNELNQLSEAIATVRQDMATAGRAALLEEFRLKAERLGVSLEDLIGAMAPSEGARVPRSDTGRKIAAKYRGPHGEEWTGRGRMPHWLAALEAEGHSRDEFLI